MCFRRGKNVLLEIRFPKNYWSMAGVHHFARELFLDAMRVDEDVFSQYYKYIYHDIRLYRNHRAVSDARRHVIFLYGDRKK